MKSTVVKIDSVSSPDDVTANLLAYLLNVHYREADTDDAEYCDIKVSSFQWQPLGRGVLSNVQLLHVCYESVDDNDTPNNLPTQFLAKFRKDEISLEDLFPVEGEFYRQASHFCPRLNEDNSYKNANEFPFRLVNAIAQGPSWILLYSS